ncbi:hypothetical protein SAMN04488061_2844 [Filomicrobium insigne]|uniref:Uncharacterized protein n=1 Tax=Filomicrobium insigne TaxID=418854 RepID=A0A1H0SEJ8_9HYPH|nr:hypothetical protein [Filomicrobium insigne]SDP39648.1 hypothetical protein SAMN04488061_2844 [Filomicrobium insigne]
MKVTPILFSGPMVCALLREIEKPGTGKTQTRRVLKARRDVNFGCELAPCELAGEINQGNFDNSPYAPGDLLWVRETWCEGPIGRDGVVEDWRDFFYRATDHDVMGVDDGDGFSVLNADGSLRSPWRPSIHMPRRASRLTLEVTDVRVERLQDISEEDALAEGVLKVKDHCYVVRGFGYDESGLCHSRATIPFAQLWDSLNEARGAGWDVNPWVVAVTFKVHPVNIDALLEKLTKYAPVREQGDPAQAPPARSDCVA